MLEHLKINEVDLEKTPANVGPLLTMDPKTERFKGNDRANAMLKRDYRKPYIMNETV